MLTVTTANRYIQQLRQVSTALLTRDSSSVLARYLAVIKYRRYLGTVRSGNRISTLGILSGTVCFQDRQVGKHFGAVPGMGADPDPVYVVPYFI